jgi:hypothetical protein
VSLYLERTARDYFSARAHRSPYRSTAFCDTTRKN